ncbi:MAG: twin-arginine translocation signal domain-containing protein, partial [Polyangiaceae bacterium]
MKTKGIVSRPVSRRGFLKGAAATAGAIAGTRLAGGNFVGDARAAGTETSAVLVIFTLGGYNSIFPSFDSLAGTSFGAGQTGVNLCNGLVVD